MDATTAVGTEFAAMPSHDYVYYGIPCAPYIEDEGVLVAGHERRSWAALNAYYRKDPWHSIKARDVTAKWVIFHKTCGCTEEQHAEHLEVQHAEMFRVLRSEPPTAEEPQECGNTCKHVGLPPCDTEMYGWVPETVEPGTPGALPVLEYRS